MSDLDSARRDYIAALEDAVQTQEELAAEVTQIAAMLDGIGKAHMANVFAAVAQDFRVQSIKHQAQAAALRSGEPEHSKE